MNAQNHTIQDYIATENTSLVSAMKKIDHGARGILFIVDEDSRLIGCVTDGDVRRWIISHSTLDAKVSDFMKKDPVCGDENDLKNKESAVKKYKVRALPITDKKHKIVDIIFGNGIEYEVKRIHRSDALKDIPVVIMAGGKGTRLYPYTKILPKPLIPIGDTPIAELIINRFRDEGCKSFYMIVNHKKNMIKSYFNDMNKDYSLEYVDEERALGTGGGLSLLQGVISRTFVLTNCDILLDESFEEVYKHHKTQGNIITMVCSLKNYNVPYGVVHLAEEGKIDYLEEKPQLSFFTNTGCYFVEPEVLDRVPVDTEIGFPDIIDNCIRNGDKVGFYPVGESMWHDMGQLDGMEQMIIQSGMEGSGK